MYNSANFALFDIATHLLGSFWYIQDILSILESHIFSPGKNHSNTRIYQFMFKYWLFLGVIEGSIFQKLSVQICRFVFRYLNCWNLSPKKHKGQVKIICWYFWHIYILASPNILPLNAIMSPTQWKAGDLLKTTMTSIDCIWSSLMDVLPIHSLRFGPSCWFCQCYPRSKMLHLADWLAFQLFELR